MTSPRLAKCEAETRRVRGMQHSQDSPRLAETRRDSLSAACMYTCLQCMHGVLSRDVSVCTPSCTVCAHGSASLIPVHNVYLCLHTVTHYTIRAGQNHAYILYTVYVRHAYAYTQSRTSGAKLHSWCTQLSHNIPRCQPNTFLLRSLP